MAIIRTGQRVGQKAQLVKPKFEAQREEENRPSLIRQNQIQSTLKQSQETAEAEIKKTYGNDPNLKIIKTDTEIKVIKEYQPTSLKPEKKETAIAIYKLDTQGRITEYKEQKIITRRYDREIVNQPSPRILRRYSEGQPTEEIITQYTGGYITGTIRKNFKTGQQVTQKHANPSRERKLQEEAEKDKAYQESIGVRKPKKEPTERFFLKDTGQIVQIARGETPSQELKQKGISLSTKLGREKAQAFTERYNETQAKVLAKKLGITPEEAKDPDKVRKAQEPTTQEEFFIDLQKKQGKDAKLIGGGLVEVTDGERKKVYDLRKKGKEQVADVPKDAIVYGSTLNLFINKQDKQKKQQYETVLDYYTPLSQRFSEDKNLEAVYIDGKRITRKDILGKPTPSGTITEYDPQGFVETYSYRQKSYAATSNNYAGVYFAGLGVTALKFPVGVVEGFKESTLGVITKPVKTVTGTLYFTYDLLQGKASIPLADQLTTDPTELGRVGGQVYGSYLGFKALKGAGNIAKNKALGVIAKTKYADNLPKSWFIKSQQVTRLKSNVGGYTKYQKVQKTGNLYKQSGFKAVEFLTEKITKVTQTRVKGYTKSVGRVTYATSPVNINKASFKFLAEGKSIQAGVFKQANIKTYIGPRLRTYSAKPQSFEVVGAGRSKVQLSTKTGDIKLIKNTPVKAEIDPTKFKQTPTSGGKITILKQEVNRVVKAKTPSGGLFKVEYGVVAPEVKVSQILEKKVADVSQVLGIGSPTPIYENVLVSSGSSGKPIIGVTPKTTVSTPLFILKSNQQPSTKTEIGPTLKPIVETETGEKEKAIIITEYDLDEYKKIKPIVDTFPDLRNDNIAEIKRGYDNKPIIENIPIVENKPIVDVTVKPDQRIGTLQQYGLKQEVIEEEKPRVEEPLFKPIINLEEDKNKLPKFEVLVRRSGTFKGFGTFTDINEAVAKGRGVVESTAAASFKVEGSKPFELFSRLPKSVYRPSKISQDIAVQRREKRISSSGEKLDITFRGIATSKQRTRKKKGFINFGKGFNIFEV